jgi:hypothetical protein
MTQFPDTRITQLRREFAQVEKILQDTPPIDKHFSIPTEEFVQRQENTYDALHNLGFEAGFVFSDEHYDGDVPYLGGNTNIQIEQVAGVIGRKGFHIAAGLEGGYIAEQLAPRARAQVHKVEMLKLADEEYPINARRLEEVIEAAAGRKISRIALLTPRQVIPAAIVEYLEKLVGSENVVDCQETYYKIKYEKSDNEMRLIRDANIINSCLRRSCVAVADPTRVTDEQRFWFDFVEEAYDVGLRALKDVAAHAKPACLQEQALVEFFRAKEDVVSRKLGRNIQLERLKPYTGTHNAGYTECQEFYGAITLNSKEPLGRQIVIMLDVAIRGIGDYWDDVVIPGMDFVVIENTCGKFGPRLEELNQVPWNVQRLVGLAYSR